MKLRDYQLEAVEAIWRAIIIGDTALCVLPTGSGKTEVMMAMIAKAIEIKASLRCVVMMGRIDLVSQTERRFRRTLNPKHIGVWCGSLSRRESQKNITVASVHSADAAKFPPIDLIVVDEVHRLDEKDGAYSKFIDGARLRNPKLKIVGFTATPFDSDGEIHGAERLFKEICYRKTIKDMIALGFLCEPKMRSSQYEFNTSELRVRAGEYRQEDIAQLVSDRDKVEAQVRDAISRMNDRKCVVWATANIEHCNMVADVLMSIGEHCTTVHSKLSRGNRDTNLGQFMSGAIRHMSFVTVLSEGFDHPPIDCVVLMRPTRSSILYVQTCGRGIRPWEGKLDCLVLDYGQVVRNLGPLDDPKIKKKKGTGDAVMKDCPQCFLYVFGGCSTCPDCGFAFPPPAPAYEKLDHRSDGEARILSKEEPPETLKVGPANISMHEANSGNLCVKVVYEDRNIMTKWGYGGVAEFFITTSPWAMERLERRLATLNAEIPSIPFDGIIMVPGTFELVKKRDGKYDRIMSVRKISDEIPEEETKSVKATWLDKLDQDDTSFNFGANTRGNEWTGQR